MEPLTFFASAVGFTCAFHLLSVTVSQFSNSKQPSVGPQQAREDWLCFFRTSTLLGSTVSDDTQPNKTIRDTQHKVTRQQAPRPRPRLQA